MAGSDRSQQAAYSVTKSDLGDHTKSTFYWYRQKSDYGGEISANIVEIEVMRGKLCSSRGGPKA